MGFNSQQITISSSTATPLIVPGTGASGSGFLQYKGAVGDELPFIIQNIDAAITVYLGGTDVSTSNGFPLVAGASLPIQTLHADALYLYALAASGSPKVAVLAGRQ